MNIYDLRNTMKVEYYHKHAHGCMISYHRNNIFHALQLSNDELQKELIAIGSIEEGDNYEQYVISQWDALNIAIRYQLSRDTEFQINNADIGKAIENLKNKH